MKRVSWIVLGVALMAVLYYLFLMPFEFEVNLTSKTVPGDVISTVRIWNKSIAGAEINEVDSFKTLTQKINWNNNQYYYHWRFFHESDSLTRINVKISQPGRRFLNKLLIPFTDQQIEKDANDVMLTFHQVLKTHLRITKVKVKGEVQLDSTFCACRSLVTNQTDKAHGMMRDYALLTTFVDQFKLKPNGVPIVKINQWDHNSGLLKFDFCFPIIKTDSLPSTDSISYKRFASQKALKAEYYGNYITSDRAWYVLTEYAHDHGYRVKDFPIEHFHNNPSLGLGESEWKTDIYLPVSALNTPL